jgi:arsenate reductase-like glutaredoxin family protein
MKARLAFPVLLMLAASLAGAQVYKWKDEKGITHFSDTPPPPTAKQPTELKTVDAPSAPPLPAELQGVVRDHPVTLYTTAQCAACDQGRAQLRKRGIPYSEKTVLTAADIEALQKAGSTGRLPLLVVGRARQVGYDPAAWDYTLSAAGYPEESLLPSNYLHAAPTSAAPPPLPTDADRTAAAKAKPAETPRPPPVNAPPGFQF